VVIQNRDRGGHDEWESIGESIREALESARGEIEISREDMEDLREGIRDAMEAAREGMRAGIEAARESIAMNMHGLAFEHIVPGMVFADAGAGNARPVDETRAAPDVTEVEIHNVSGSIKITGWDREEIQVTGSLGEDVEELLFDVDGRSATVRVKVPKGIGRKKIRSEISVSVPRRCSVRAEGVSAGIELDQIDGENVDLETVSGSVDVRGARGDIEASSVSGQVTVAGATREVEASSVSGDVEVSGTPSLVRAESVSGDLIVSGVREEFRGETVSGSIRATAETLREIRGETVSGGITYEGGLTSGGEIRMDSVSGSVTLTLAGPVSADFELNSFAGSITVDLAGGPNLTAKRELDFSAGSGDGEVNVETFSGSIRIRSR
jgi:DUF4097 and DUF4098 domain-containing protein YvlB